MDMLTIDFHSHILPSLDDGAKSVQMSIEMLRTLYRQGIECVYATPHFKTEAEDTGSFLSRREKAYSALLSYVEQNSIRDIPQLRLGAEIQVFRGICEADLSQLTYENTTALLLELPFEKLSHQLLKELRLVCDKHLFIPVIAHLDRYTWFDSSAIDALCDIPDVVFQFNVSALNSFRGRRLIARVIRKGHHIVFGSDTHDMSERAPEFHLLTGKSKRSPLFKKEQTRFMSAHESGSDFILSQHANKTYGLLF